MAFEVYNSTMSPIAQRSSEPRISITEVGQLIFNKKLMLTLGVAPVGMRLNFDRAARKVVIQFVTSVPKGKEQEYLKVHTSEKTGQTLSSAAGFLAWAGYKYKEAGNQPYKNLAVNKEKSQVSFVLPAETPARLPARVPKKAKVPVAAVAPKVAEANSIPGTEEMEDEESLEAGE